MSTHPVVSQLTRFFSNLTRNTYLTGKHRLVASVSPGTLTYEQRELDALYREALGLWHEHPKFLDDSGEYLNNFFAKNLKDVLDMYRLEGIPVSPALESLIVKVFAEFTRREKSLFDAPAKPPDLSSSPLKQQTSTKKKLRRFIRHNRELDRYVEQWIKDVMSIIYEFLIALRLPRVSSSGQNSFLDLNTPLFELATDQALLLEMCFGFMTSESAERDEFFKPIARHLYYNFNGLVGLDHHGNPAMTLPRLLEKHSDLKTADKLLAGTPLHTLLMSALPIKVPEEVRFEHMHILAGTGHGKTQTLQHLIVSDLQRDPEDIPSMVILDSQGDMLNVLKRLALFDPKIESSLAKRLLIVDPSDVEYAPALNLFDIQSDRLENYNQRDREQVLAGRGAPVGFIEIYDYIFGGLFYIPCRDVVAPRLLSALS